MSITIVQGLVVLYSPNSCRVKHFRMCDDHRVVVTDEQLIASEYSIEQAHEIFESLLDLGWR